MPGRWTRVLVVDDYELVRLGLRRALERERWFQVVAECPGVLGAVERARAVSPDIALVSDDLPDGPTPALVRDLRAVVPPLRVIVLTERPTAAGQQAVLAAGACGYVRKRRAADRVVEQVRQAARGRPVACEAPADRAPVGSGEPAPVAGVLDALTPRELQVLEHISRGRSNEEIARALGLAEKTVKNAVTGLLAKLGVRSRTQAALLHVHLTRR